MKPEITVTNEMAHHPFGPSSLYRRQRCPGSYQEEIDKEEIPSDFSAEGEMLHEAVWENDATVEKRNLTDPQYECLDSAHLWMRRMEEEGDDEWLAENRLELFDTDGSLITFGTADAIRINWEAELAKLGDFKFGFIAVDPPDLNLQMATYAGCLLQKYAGRIKRVHASIIQPRVNPEQFPAFTFTNADGIVATVKAIISACMQPSAPLRAGTHCRYCNAKPSCPTFAEYERSVNRISPNMITAENAYDVWMAIRMMRVRVDEANTILKHKLEAAGGTLGDIYLKERKGNRSLRTEYLCHKCGYTWTGPIVARCPECDTNKIEATGGGPVAFFEEVQGHISTERFMHACKPVLGRVEKEVVNSLKDSGLVATKKEGKELYDALPCFIPGAPIREIAQVEKKEEVKCLTS